MNRLLFPIVLLLQITANAQSAYHPMLVPGRSWDIFIRPTEWPICQYDYASHYMLGPDTLMDGHWYKPLRVQVIRSNPPVPFCGGFYLDTTQTYPGGWVREDTMSRRVYKREPGDGAEVLLFDFSLQKGDTLWYADAGFAIDSVFDFTLINGETRRAFVIESFGVAFNQNMYVEGLGYLLGAFNQVFLPFEGWSETTCVRNGMEILYGEGPGCIFSTSGSEEPLAGNLPELGPNPFSGYLILRMKAIQPAFTFALFDAQGHCCYRQEIPAGSESFYLNLPDLPKGLYFWTAQGVLMGKLVSYDP